MSGYTDILGKEITVGDYVLYGRIPRTYPVLSLGKVLGFYPSGNIKVINLIGDLLAERSCSISGRSDNIVVIDGSQIPSKQKALLDSYKSKG